MKIGVEKNILDSRGKRRNMHMKDIFPELRSIDISNLLRKLKEEKKLYMWGQRDSGTGGWLKLHLKNVLIHGRAAETRTAGAEASQSG